MNNKDFVTKLKELSACSEAVEWAKKYSTLQGAWKACERADHMLWYICKMEIGTRKERIHIICDCVATALKYVPKGEDRPRLAIKAARKYADKRTPENLERLNAAWVATGAAAWAAAWVAARDATGAAARAAARAAAGAAAWAAAGAAAGDSARAAAGAAARAAAHKKMCKIIRKKISIKDL